jgi:hypothetical protein
MNAQSTLPLTKASVVDQLTEMLLGRRKLAARRDRAYYRLAQREPGNTDLTFQSEQTQRPVTESLKSAA